MDRCIKYYFLTIIILAITINTIPTTTTSCPTDQSASPWNADISRLPGQLASWLDSLDTVRGEGRAQSRLYDPVTGQFTNLYAGWNDGQKEDRILVTIGLFAENIPAGLAWQWRSRRKLDGFLYGEVDHGGQFTGEQISFIYPDFLTGLRGTFENGVLQRAQAVDVVAERCNNGVKELKLKPSKHDKDVVWEKEETNASYIGKNPKVMDPHERKSVYVGNSTNPKANEGIFARRQFSPGDIVSYFGGQKLFHEDVVFPNMTSEEKSSAGAYYIGLGHNPHNWWGYPDKLLLDVTEQYRSIVEYRTTLGHKANHKFEAANAKSLTVDHPVLGGIVCLVATTEIAVDDEIFYHYGYIRPDQADHWYREEYNTVYGGKMMDTSGLIKLITGIERSTAR